MGLILDLLQTYKRWTQNNVARSSYQTVEYNPTFCSVTEDPANKRLVVSGPTATQPGTFTTLTTTNLVITGSMTQGPLTTVTAAASTVGSTPGPVITLPLPDNSCATIAAQLTGRDPAFVGAVTIFVMTSAETRSGAFLEAPVPNYPTTTVNSLGLSFATALSWAAGVLTISARPPKGTITSASANGGNVRLSLDFCTLDINGKSVTISGLTTCTEANGTHIATFVDNTTIDINVTSVHTGTDSGKIVFASGPNIGWETAASICVKS